LTLRSHSAILIKVYPQRQKIYK